MWWGDSVFVPPQPSGSEGQTGNEHEERERLRRVLKQMGRIKCPSEVCTSSFSLVLSSFTVSHSILLLLSCVFHFHSSQPLCLLCHISVPRHLPVLISFLSCPQDLLLCLSPFTSLSLSLALALSLSLLLSFSLFLPSSLSFSFMPCS